MSKSKTIKIPADLADILSRRSDDKPPGEILLAMAQDYERLEALAKCISENRMIKDDTVSGVFDKYLQMQHEMIKGFQKTQEELKTMLQGLQLFFKITKEKE